VMGFHDATLYGPAMPMAAARRMNGGGGAMNEKAPLGRGCD
jgi:hypothetical protein